MRWRALQIDRAIVEYLNGRHHEALALADKARQAASEIPPAELGLAIRVSLDQIRRRLEALREFYSR